MPSPVSSEVVSPPRSWLNRTTLGISLASLFSDVSHELATAVLPAFLMSLGAGAAALGWIEGSADGLSSLAKLWGGVTAESAVRRARRARVPEAVRRWRRRRPARRVRGSESRSDLGATRRGRRRLPPELRHSGRARRHLDQCGSAGRLSAGRIESCRARRSLPPRPRPAPPATAAAGGRDRSTTRQGAPGVSIAAPITTRRAAR